MPPGLLLLSGVGNTFFCLYPAAYTHLLTHHIVSFQVAYVLGQMQHPATVTALGTVLADLGEHQMVRHEVRLRFVAVVHGRSCVGRRTGSRLLGSLSLENVSPRYCRLWYDVGSK